MRLLFIQRWPLFWFLMALPANNAFASNGVMIPAPIASGIPLIAATPAKVFK